MIILFWIVLNMKLYRLNQQYIFLLNRYVPVCYLCRHGHIYVTWENSQRELFLCCGYLESRTNNIGMCYWKIPIWRKWRPSKSHAAGVYVCVCVFVIGCLLSLFLTIEYRPTIILDWCLRCNVWWYGRNDPFVHVLLVIFVFLWYFFSLYSVLKCMTFWTRKLVHFLNLLAF